MKGRPQVRPIMWGSLGAMQIMKNKRWKIETSKLNLDKQNKQGENRSKQGFPREKIGAVEFYGDAIGWG